MTKLPKEIVIAAYNYLGEVTTTQKISDVRLEELNPTDDNKQWLVVLSFDAVGEYPFDKKREYKEFKVDSETGNVLSMSIKKIT